MWLLLVLCVLLGQFEHSKRHLGTFGSKYLVTNLFWYVHKVNFQILTILGPKTQILHYYNV